MKYTKTTFTDETSPYIEAAWLNGVGSMLESLAAATSSKASIQSDSTSGVYTITVDGYTSAPTLGAGELFRLTLRLNGVHLHIRFMIPAQGQRYR